jgi:hypothetical protein
LGKSTKKINTSIYSGQVSCKKCLFVTQICRGVLFGQTMDDYWLTICFIDDNCLGVNGMDEIFWKSGKGGKSGNFGNRGNHQLSVISFQF